MRLKTCIIARYLVFNSHTSASAYDVGTLQIFDITATKDWANCKARADVVVDDEVVLEGVPTQFLLFLEKNPEELRGFIDRLPTLDPKEDWIYDENQGLYRTAPSRTQRTRKVQKAIVLYDATDKHPAQTQLITEDETAGYWHRVLLSRSCKN